MNSTDTLVIIAPMGATSDQIWRMRQDVERRHPGPVVVLPHGCSVPDVESAAIRAAVAIAVSEERTACAKVAEMHEREWRAHGQSFETEAAHEIAVAIRART